ncbi:MAG: hypothetical protein K2J80_11450 [Oscillospiraceae bacterium]|nr:hypothetical protein [Oscillospiraceae bacterium]
MSILETIYDSYMSCELSLQPEVVGSHISEKISEIVKLCDMNSEQASKFEDMLFDILDYDGKNMFFAGFKVASQLAEEISEKRKNADEQ